MLQFVVLGCKVLVWIIVVCLENVSNKLYNPEWERHIAKWTTTVWRLWGNSSSFPKAYKNKTLPGVSLWTEAHSRSGVLNTFSASALLSAKGTLRSEWDAKHVSAPQVRVSSLGLGNRHRRHSCWSRMHWLLYKQITLCEPYGLSDVSQYDFCPFMWSLIVRRDLKPNTLVYFHFFH